MSYRIGPSLRPFILGGLLSLSPILIHAAPIQLSSPDSSITLSVELDPILSYQLSVDGVPVLKPSAINMQFTDGSQFGLQPTLVAEKRLSVDEVVRPEINVRSQTIRNHYNELKLTFKEDFDLVFRAFDEGIAYRFESRKKQKIELKTETATFAFPTGTYSYFPFEKNFRSATQPLFTPTPVKSIDGEELGSLPALFVSAGINLLLTETDLQDYPGLWIRGDGQGGIYGVHPFDLDFSTNLDGDDTRDLAKFSKQRSFPWRILGIARNDAELFNNQLSYLLSEPSRISDVSWIKPGKIAWDWYNENNLKGVDFKAGINTKTYQHYADFAAKFGIESILLDDGWSSHDDVLTVLPNIDMPAIIRHAKSKGVSVQLWVPWSGLDKNMEAAMKRYANWGITGLKIDFMNSDSQAMVNFYWRAAAMAAKYKLMVNFHGAYKPAGIHRTYPNVLTREGVKGLENHKWSNVITPTHNLHLPFIRMITGPMDYTPGAMRNTHMKDFAVTFSRPMSLGTRAHQVAMYILYESPLQMLADTPSAYFAEPDIPQFIAAIPTVWDDYKVLQASIGDYLVMARKNGNNWYLGAMTNEQPRQFEVTLDFLEQGNYRVQILRDGINADRFAEDYMIETRTMKKGDKLALDLAGGGGYSAIITPL